jgi:hypothetical protein
MSASTPAPHRRRIARLLNAVLWGGWIVFVLVSALVVIDPTGVGGVAEPDGLEGVGLIVAVMALPVLIVTSLLIAKAPSWVDRRRRPDES